MSCLVLWSLVDVLLKIKNTHFMVVEIFAVNTFCTIVNDGVVHNCYHFHERTQRMREWGLGGPGPPYAF